MELTSGEQLGPYTILSVLGSGGMGSVYRANDPRLHREVAIKVSAERFSDRFEREARAVAALNHQNVCTLFDIGPNYLVMELIEGETLADHLKQGAMPFGQAMDVAKQITSALEAAHERGITHRDLKPGNVILRHDGMVKVLDFGLAKMAEPISSAGSDPSQSPTMTMEAATKLGLILGTAGYMAPEQAKGKLVDKRADIWAFGVVFYEMLVGTRLFEGETMAETMAAVLKEEPKLDRAPEQVRRLLGRCLEKDPHKRLRDISVVWELLDVPKSGTEPTALVFAEKRRSRWLWPAAAALSLLVAAVAFWAPWRSVEPPSRPLVRLSVALGPDAVRVPRVSVLLSPDGTRIAFTGRGPGGTMQLYTRRLDQPGVILLATVGISADLEPFFSPDGKWIGFSDDTRLMKVPSEGGAPVSVGALPGQLLGASWGDDNNIVLGIGTSGLWRMPAAGGAAQQLKKAGSLLGPDVLPGSKAVLFSRGTSGFTSFDEFDIVALQPDTGQIKTLVRSGYWPRYLPTSGQTGHLVYVSQGTLFGVGFDPRSLQLLGTPAPLLEDVGASADLNDGGGQFTFSNTGMLVYLTGDARASYPIQWLDAAGKTLPLVAQPGIYGAPRLSPDGKRLAYVASGSKGYDVWVHDLERGTSAQLTFLGSVNRELAWARDSRHLMYGDGMDLWWLRSDGAGERQLLFKGSEHSTTTPRPTSVAPDGRLAFAAAAPSLPDIWTLPLDVRDSDHPRPGKPEPFLADPNLVEADPAFSPDGKFIAYASSEAGVEEVYVRPFPGPGGKWKVSTGGGKFPAWSGTTHELLFLGSGDQIMAVSYRTQGDTFDAGMPRVWSPMQVRRIGVQQSFDVSPDGKRVVMFPRQAAENAGGNLHATFLLNFFDEVRRRLPVGK